ncbi:NAD-dependent epimerase/dehydratase family protein, partial [Prochlorococcus sp. AH-716-F10]|nr:NAD-dependent epimerase/dehydratase family protein [Prochlorococcus sp. AH-716-F10]
MNKPIFVTGAAGFIGFHISKKLISNQIKVIGFDNLNSYYDVNLKRSRLKEIEKLSKNFKGWKFLKGDLIEKDLLLNYFEKYRPNIVIHLAAQAGVRHSLENPDAYIQSNIVGFNNILECCKKYPVEHFLYASSSSVYGGNQKIPFSEKDAVDHPVSLYAATKRSNELIAHSYSHLFRIPSTSMRFFTVYGPWGRPDMAPMIFTNSIIKKEPIMIFNKGNMSRDFTYIDDVTEVIYRLLKKPPLTSTTFDKNNPDKSISWAPHRILNIGN